MNYSSSSSSPIDESVPMRLFTSNAEKSQVSDMEELFSIFVATEYLEKIYVREAITPEVYRSQATNLISKFKQLIESLGWDTNDINRFVNEYGIRTLQKAYKRLVIDKVDGVTLHGKATSSNSTNNLSEGDALNAYETATMLVTALDAIKMLSAVDEITGYIRDLCDRLNAVTFAPKDWPARAKIINWSKTLSSMRASDIISDEDKRQMAVDVEAVHVELGKLLAGKK